jgi:hypothetical protein
MRLHRNAALSWNGRRLLARRVLEQGWTLTAAAEAAGVECPRFRGQLSGGLSGPAERLSGHAKEAEVPEAVSV